MPEWSIEILKQLPVTLAAVAAIFLAFHFFQKSYSERLKQIDEKHAKKVDLLVNAYDELIEAKDAEIQRLLDERKS